MFSWVQIKHLAEWCGAKGEFPALPVSSISTDSRDLKPGEVFLALRGESFDGHDYVNDAVKKGAVAVIAERSFPLAVPLLVVPDSLQAFISIAQRLRAHFTGPVFAVTGSAGKSSTKEMIAALWGPQTLASPASFNNLLGVSKTLSLLRDDTRQLILEMGMNALGEIAEICAKFSPEAGLITNIGDAHLGKLGSRRGIYQAKKELFDSLARIGTRCRGIALNVDDELVGEAYRSVFPTGVKTVTYSASGAPADVRVLKRKIDPDTGRLSLQLEIEGETVDYAFSIFGMHHTQNIAAAVAASRLLGVKLEEMLPRFAAIHPASHRGEIKTLAEGRILIDESYNSNPTALASSLESLNALDLTRRRILVVGEMREMGKFSEQVHQEAGENLVRLQREGGFPLLLIGVGTEVLPLVNTVKAALPTATTFQLSHQREVLSLIQSHWKAKDILFFKGSHGVRLDLVVDALAQ